MDANQQELTKMILQATLLANLTLLKDQMPALYEAFKDYTPSDTGVAIDASGNVNLFNNNEFVYQESPIKFANQQVEEFLREPLYFKYQLNHQDDKELLFEHAALLKSIYNVRTAETDNKINNPAKEKRLDFVCFLGGGLGYQIEELLNQKDVLNVFLFEPSKDTFYALLHCVELKPLFDKCVANGGRFSIRVSGSEDGVINEISNLLFEQGHFNISQALFFKHYGKNKSELTKRLKILSLILSCGDISYLLDRLNMIDQGKISKRKQSSKKEPLVEKLKIILNQSNKNLRDLE